VPDLDPLASIQRFYDAENDFVRSAPEDRDIHVMLAELDPDVVVDVPASLPHGGVWRGHEGFRDLFDAVTRHWREFEVVYSQDKWHAIDDQRILIEGVLRAALQSTGVRVEMPFVSLFTFTPRGASRLDHYYKDTAAILLPAREG
jgi:ketosteroid isomerase-like protein